MSAEYVDDVAYLRQFVADLSPARLRLVAALNGVAPPPAADFDYCELGCAHGDTLVALAAAHPEARFLGVDIGAAHVASARRLARDGALENVGFLERDFSALAAEDVGRFDYVVAHGVLSWVSPAKRKAVIDFASTRLKPGGLLHVSYNAMPGWASVEPLRQLLLFGGGPAGGEPSLERARKGVELAEAMKRAGAGYFVKNPSASEMLETMAKVGLPYVVHEYLHEHWAPMYFGRVAWEMAASDLHFAGALPVHANFPETALSEAQARLLGAVTDRIAFESLKDFALDEFFRRDVYVKGALSRSPGATNAYLESTAWGTLAIPVPAERSVRLPHRTLEFDGPLFDALFAALAEGATTVEALATRDGLASVGREGLRAAMVRLVVAGHVIPLLARPSPSVPRAGDRYAVPSAYNQSMLRRLSGGDGPIVMASAVAGTAFPITALEGLAIRVLTEAAPPDRARWVHDLVSRKALRLRIGDRAIDDPADQQRAVTEAVEHLRAQRLAKLVELGILGPALREGFRTNDGRSSGFR